MSYSKSQIDIDNSAWFHNDKSRNTLLKLSVSNGQVRSITPMEVSFNYPITAIVGENGAGKSTILALASCAFHNESTFFPQNRIRTSAKKPRGYYTYGDFFTFAPDETGISGIEIIADYLTPDGIKQDIRKKKPSGKWNDFNRRPKRAVAYLGINRIVPPSESSPHRHYCRNFKKSPLDDGQVKQLKESMTSILGRNYSNIELKEYNSYRLFETNRGTLKYTGFNMGAGENAVLGLLLEIISAGDGALIVVDEIELGLHTQAQVCLISELKRLCKKYKCQIICSTHSKDILSNLPPEGRIFIKRSDTKTDIIPKISPEYAFGKLSGTRSEELSVFVEDEVGQAFIDNILPQSLRERVKIMPVGSDQAVLKHMAVHYREEDKSFITFLDGDKRTQHTDALKKIKAHLEGRLECDEEEFISLMTARLNYIPGETWPEKELVESALHADSLDWLSKAWDIPIEDIQVILEEALAAGKHNEFFTINKRVCLSIEQIRVDVIRFYKQTHSEQIDAIIAAIRQLLA